EDDDSVAAELTQGLASLAAAVEDLEVLALLGGEFDDRDAIVTIHPGAGGTESQDWAEMLWRMLVRWAERRGFKVTVNDYQEGDEAGIKSVTMTLEVRRAGAAPPRWSGSRRTTRPSGGPPRSPPSMPSRCWTTRTPPRSTTPTCAS